MPRLSPEAAPRKKIRRNFELKKRNNSLSTELFQDVKKINIKKLKTKFKLNNKKRKK